MEICYDRVLLKLSGEALAGGRGYGLDTDTIIRICQGIKGAHDLGGQIAIVVGGGDTASDCVGTAFRQGALSVTQLDIRPCPPQHENKALS